MKTELSYLRLVLAVKHAVSPEQKSVETSRPGDHSKGLSQGLGQRGPLSPIVEISVIVLAIALALLLVIIK